jgi:DNA-binding FadR family transcriptional regulator
MFAPRSRPTDSAAEHATIVDAIARSDAKQARAAVAAHIRTVRKLVEAIG